jgi:predicted dehydrogenase
MKEKFCWGIIGCGRIAPKFFQALENTGEGHVVAAASRSLRRARKLQEKLGVERIYDSYAEMLDREKLEAVYIATTHNFHAENTKLCLEHGLPVLVEKSFTRNLREANELIALARQKNLFLMQALWTLFNPASVKVCELLRAGAIGELKHLRADFCVRMPRLSWKMMPWNRMYNPWLSGGALLDLGVYLIAFSDMVFGRPPVRISGGSAEKAITGVDKTFQCNLDYGRGRWAELRASFVEGRPRDAVITGTKGALRVPHFSGTDRIVLTRPGCAPETIECGPPGFEHEIREMHRCLREGQIESPVMPLDETLEIMRTMDALRVQWGLKYPGE